MATIKFKSIDDYAKYVHDNDILINSSTPHNKEEQKVQGLKKNLVTQKGVNTPKLKNRTSNYNPNLSFKEYVKLSQNDKIEWLKNKGIHFSCTGIYSYKDSVFYTKLLNPFSNNAIYLYKRKAKHKAVKDVKDGERVLLKLTVRKNPRNISELFDYTFYKEKNNSSSSNISQSTKAVSKKVSKAKENKESSLKHETITISDDINTEDVITDRDLLEKYLYDSTWSSVDAIEANSRIHFDDFVTLTDVNRCTKNNHNIEDIDALIFILRKDGRIMPRTLPAHYCKTCNKYYITRWQFEQICDLGILMCQMITEDGTRHHSSNQYFDNLNEESILHRSGYNVNSKDDLSVKQRQMIIAMVIESGMRDCNQISNHLTWLINNWRGNQSKQNAIQKWTEDRDFVSNYRKGTHRAVGVKLIRHKK